MKKRFATLRVLMSWRFNIKELRSFMGRRAEKFLLLSAFAGVLLFFVETWFVYVLQGFLAALNLIPQSQLNLPSWYPSSSKASLIFLLFFGVFRSLGLTLKDYFAGASNETFMRYQNERIVRHTLTHAHSLATHEIVQTFNVYVRSAGSQVQQLSQFITTAISAVLLFGLGLKMAPVQLAIGVFLLALCSFPLGRMRKSIRESGRLLNEEGLKVSETLIVGIRNHFLLRVYHRIAKEVENAELALTRMEKFVRRYLWLASFSRSYPLFIGTAVISLITVVSVKYLHTPGIVLLTFFYIFVRFSQTASECLGLTSSIALSSEHVTRLVEFNRDIDRSLALQDDANGSEIFPNEARNRALAIASILKNGIVLEAHGVGFGYPGHSKLFDKMNFRAGRGDVLLIRGPSGSGKSTLLTLLLGLQRPEVGEVHLNEFNIREVAPVLAKFCAYVGPEPFLIRGTVRENLLYAHPEPQSVTDRDLVEALEKAQLTSLIDSLPQGVETLLHESSRISTGQRQRLALARAFARKPLLLVFDEATANLDLSTEQDILMAIAPQLKNLTTIIVSHKESFNSLSTQNIVLESRLYTQTV